MSFKAGLKSYYTHHQEQIQKIYPGLTLERFCDEFFSFYQSRGRLVLPFPHELMTAKDFFIVESFLLRLKQGIPLEYINHCAHFYSSDFYVNPHVLIPRSETEILVEKGIDFLRSVKQKSEDKRLRICDVGSGSGAIMLSILENLDFPVDADAYDIDAQALKVAQINGHRLAFKRHPDTQIFFHQNDRLAGVTQKYDLIVSNPPYIKRSDDARVHMQVRSYEPEIALYLDDECYQSWYAEFFKQVNDCLSDRGLFIMEGDDQSLSSLKKTAQQLLIGSSIEVVADYCQRDRFLIFKR